MRASRQRSGGPQQRDDAEDASGNKVEFGHGGGVPERDEAALAVGGDDGSVRKRAGNAVELRKVEAVNHFSIGGVEQNGFVGGIAGDEDAFLAAAFADAEAGGVGDVLEIVAADFACGNS